MSDSAAAPGRLRSADLWAGLCVTALGVVALVASFDIFVPTGLNDSLGPRTFPIVISLLVMALGVVLSLRSLVRNGSTAADLGTRSTLVVMSVALAGYLALFGVLGFLLATVVFLTALFLYLGERRLWFAVVAAALISVAVSAAFTMGLNVALPRGLLGF